MIGGVTLEHFKFYLGDVLLCHLPSKYVEIKVFEVLVAPGGDKESLSMGLNRAICYSVEFGTQK